MIKSTTKINVADIARQCGVSAMTVSRALRNDESVKEATRKHIITVAESLGYIRSPRMGRPSRQPSAKPVRLQLIVGNNERSMAIFHSQLLTTIEQQLAKRGYDCVIRTCNGNYEQFVMLLENLRASDADGTMLVGSFAPRHLEALLEAAPEAILLDNPGVGIGRLTHHSLVFDNVEAAKIGVDHLLSLGRRQILLLSGTPGHFFSSDIEQGCREALTRAGLKVNEKLMFNSDFTAESAAATVAEALETGLRFDAVFTNDEMAAGVYRALLAKNLNIPRDVAVCGCDGLPVGLQLYPRLTTVFLDYDELGRNAIEYLLDGRNRRGTVKRVVLIPRLIVRESTSARNEELRNEKCRMKNGRGKINHIEHVGSVGSEWRMENAE